MADPATLTIMSMVASGVGTAAQMAGARQKADADAAAANYNAQVARNNATIAEQYAQESTQRGEVLAQTQQMKTAALVGGERAAMAANGVNLDEGSPLNVQEDTSRLGALDTATIRHNAALDAYGYRTQGTSYTAQAGLLDMQAENAKKAGDINVLSSFASGASSVSSNWAKWKQVGAS